MSITSYSCFSVLPHSTVFFELEHNVIILPISVHAVFRVSRLWTAESELSHVPVASSASRQRGDSAVLPLAPHIGRLSVLYICQPSIYTLWSHRSGIEISSLSRGHTVPWLIWKELEVKCRGKRRVWTCGNTQWTINSNLVSIFISIINESC